MRLKQIVLFIGLSLFLVASKPCPKTKFKINNEFNKVKVSYQVDGKEYQFIVFQGMPFKRPPIKGWEYYNPAEVVLESGAKAVFEYAQKNGLINEKSERPTIIRPYYELNQAVSYDQYNQFVRYTRDSVVRTILGHSNVLLFLQNNDGSTRLYWDQPIPWNDANAKNALYELYSLESPPKYINRIKEFQYGYETINLEVATKSRFLKGTPRSEFISRFRFPIYPDTFLWASDAQIGVDSAAALALANGGFQMLKNTNRPIGLDSNMVKSYTHWMNNQCIPKDIAYRYATEVKGVETSAEPFSLHFKAEELSHYAITKNEYQEFVIYCRDSFFRNQLGIMIYNNDGTARINWKANLDLDDEEIKKQFTSSLTEDGKHINPKYIRFYWEEINQNALANKMNELGWDAFYQEYSINDFLERKQQSVLPTIDWMEFAEFKKLKTPREFKKDELIKGLTYNQAKAFWYWRLKQLDEKDITLADYMMPTKGEWLAIQNGQGVSDKTIALKQPHPCYTYRVYIGNDGTVERN